MKGFSCLCWSNYKDYFADDFSGTLNLIHFFILIGSFSRVQMDLGGNQFFKLEEQVFLPLLESMHGNPGSIYIVPSELISFFRITGQEHE